MPKIFVVKGNAVEEVEVPTLRGGVFARRILLEGIILLPPRKAEGESDDHA